jgi:hypothetical protein
MAPLDEHRVDGGSSEPAPPDFSIFESGDYRSAGIDLTPEFARRVVERKGPPPSGWDLFKWIAYNAPKMRAEEAACEEDDRDALPTVEAPAEETARFASALAGTFPEGDPRQKALRNLAAGKPAEPPTEDAFTSERPVHEVFVEEPRLPQLRVLPTQGPALRRRGCSRERRPGAPRRRGSRRAATRAGPSDDPDDESDSGRLTPLPVGGAGR